MGIFSNISKFINDHPKATAVLLGASIGAASGVLAAVIPPDTVDRLNVVLNPVTPAPAPSKPDRPMNYWDYTNEAEKREHELRMRELELKYAAVKSDGEVK